MRRGRCKPRFAPSDATWGNVARFPGALGGVGAGGSADEFFGNRIQQFLFPAWACSGLASASHTVGLIVEQIFQKVRLSWCQSQYNVALLHRPSLPPSFG
jgi:hypothetical protein